MPQPGPDRQTSDLRLLLELAVKDEYAFAREITEMVELTSVQTVRDRLNGLVDETDHVEMKKVSGSNVYRLTDAGKGRLLDELRDRLD
jgi:hypothetical protein